MACRRPSETVPGPLVEPIPGRPVAVARTNRHEFLERSFVIADYHTGIEADLRYERRVELLSRAAVRRKYLLSPLGQTDTGRLVALGDLGHRVGDPDGDEARELRDLAAAVIDCTELTVTPGSHDGGLTDFFGDDVEVTDPRGIHLGSVGFRHDHIWSSRKVLTANVICPAHEHPAVRLEDEVGDVWKKRVWLRGALVPEVFAEYHEVIPTEVA